MTGPKVGLAYFGCAKVITKVLRNSLRALDESGHVPKASVMEHKIISPAAVHRGFLHSLPTRFINGTIPTLANQGVP